MRKALAGRVTALPVLLDRKGLATWGVEYRIAKGGEGTLVALTNFQNEASTISLPIEGIAVNLLTNKVVDQKQISIEPLEFTLLRISPSTGGKTDVNPSPAPTTLRFCNALRSRFTFSIRGRNAHR